jgi:hypothetical protein
LKNSEKNSKKNNLSEIEKIKIKKMSKNKFIGASLYKYKTELCSNFLEYGFCNRESCAFAHGIKELRTKTLHLKYKTTACKKYWKDSVCPYGKSCAFIHEDSILRYISGPKLDPTHLKVFEQYHNKKK